MLRLMNLKKNIYGWSDKIFTELLELLMLMLPKDNTLLDRHYEAKKVLCSMGLQYKKIHACPNDYILYRKKFESLHKCPCCGLSRYKVKDDRCSSDEDVVEKGPPTKVLWYLPIIPRFKRLFANATDAMNLTWHEDNRNCDGMLCHPTNSPQWKKIDGLFPDFGSEARNLRLELASDGMNPFGNLSTNHSSWPVLLSIYNFPPWLCMKRKYVILCMMIAGTKQSGNDIDVYLSPFIEDLRILWEEGVDVFDGYHQQSFKLHAMILCTINDFPTYGNLSGYSVKGHHACPICEKQTSYLQLKHGKKTVYIRHRKFLRPNHPYRRLKKAFNGCQ
uniref:Transposase-associated domain-containing protein n=1 Tax=Cajanus cajan TaxID=3821 RepID=A0A151UDV0_CAJCA